MEEKQVTHRCRCYPVGSGLVEVWDTLEEPAEEREHGPKPPHDDMLIRIYDTDKSKMRAMVDYARMEFCYPPLSVPENEDHVPPKWLVWILSFFRNKDDDDKR